MPSASGAGRRGRATLPPGGTAINVPTLAKLRPERLSLVDTAWLHMEVPTNLMMAGSLTFFETPVDRNQLLIAYRTRLLPQPRFVERIDSSPLGPPRWVPDRLFDLNAHLHSVALPAPGGDAELRTLVGDLMSTPLDMTRPPWDAHLVENYRGGTVLVSRLHHCIGDGTALMQVLLELTGRTAEESLLAPRHRTTPTNRDGRSWVPQLDPRRAIDGLIQLSAQAYTLARLMALWPDSSTPLRGSLVRTKNVAWTQTLSLESLRPLRKLTGYTVNDILVAAVTGALRTCIRKRGAEVPEHIRALVPVDLRRTSVDARLGNQFGLVFLNLPVGRSNRMDRLNAVHEGMDAARNSPQPSVALEVLGALGLVPPMIQRQVVRFFGSKGTAVVTNVRGPAEELFLAGSKVSGMTFFVPQSAMLGIGISIMTYAGQIQMGVIADSGLVPDPGAIAHDITLELRTLIKV